MPRLLQVIEIDLVHLEQREVALAVPRRADFALNRIAGPQSKSPHLARRHIDIVRPRQIVRFRRPQETKAILQHLEHAAT